MATPLFWLLEPKALDTSLTTFLFLFYPSLTPLANPPYQLYSQMIYAQMMQHLLTTSSMTTLVWATIPLNWIIETASLLVLLLSRPLLPHSAVHSHPIETQVRMAHSLPRPFQWLLSLSEWKPKTWQWPTNPKTGLQLLLIPATHDSLLFLEHTIHPSASGPLCLLYFLQIA